METGKTAKPYCKIRVAMFETNSSSTHSISINHKEAAILDKLPVTIQGVIKIWPGDFGWEEAEYTDACTKASYALTYALNTSIAGAMRRRLTILKSAIRKVQPGHKIKIMRLDDSYYEFGSIDHQSYEGEGDACAPAFASVEAMVQFIFNPSSVLRTGNDN